MIVLITELIKLLITLMVNDMVYFHIYCPSRPSALGQKPPHGDNGVTVLDSDLVSLLVILLSGNCQDSHNSEVNNPQTIHLLHIFTNVPL